MVVLLGLAANSSATSPMPEEVKPGQNESVCIIHVVYVTDREKEIPGEESSSTFVFENSMPKKTVIEKVAKHISEKLNEGNVSEFRAECKFAKQ